MTSRNAARLQKLQIELLQKQIYIESISRSTHRKLIQYDIDRIERAILRIINQEEDIKLKRVAKSGQIQAVVFAISQNELDLDKAYKNLAEYQSWLENPMTTGQGKRFALKSIKELVINIKKYKSSLIQLKRILAKESKPALNVHRYFADRVEVERTAEEYKKTVRMGNQEFTQELIDSYRNKSGEAVTPDLSAFLDPSWINKTEGDSNDNLSSSDPDNSGDIYSTSGDNDLAEDTAVSELQLSSEEIENGNINSVNSSNILSSNNSSILGSDENEEIREDYAPVGESAKAVDRPPIDFSSMFD